MHKNREFPPFLKIRFQVQTSNLDGASSDDLQTHHWMNTNSNNLYHISIVDSKVNNKLKSHTIKRCQGGPFHRHVQMNSSRICVYFVMFKIQVSCLHSSHLLVRSESYFMESSPSLNHGFASERPCPFALTLIFLVFNCRLSLSYTFASKCFIVTTNLFNFKFLCLSRVWFRPGK